MYVCVCDPIRYQEEEVCVSLYVCVCVIPYVTRKRRCVCHCMYVCDPIRYQSYQEEEVGQTFWRREAMMMMTSL